MPFAESRSVVLAALVLATVVGCDPREEWPPPGEAPPGQDSQSLAGSNGLTLNGLVINGLVINGLVVNGLPAHGLGSEGLTSPEFTDWFEQDPALSDMVMKYVIYCAAKRGHQHRFTRPSTGATYTWEGWLGLADRWAKGSPATLDEQQLISACLAAHVNTYGLHVQLSLLGETSTDHPIHSTRKELEEYDIREACFFGNLFNGEGLYAGNDRNALPPEKSTPRRCGLSPLLSGADPECSPITRVGSCELLSCTLEPEGNYYRRCTYDGTPYRVLTTRLRASDVYTCGDGICQVSEQCGTGGTADNCGLDCGPCP